MSMAPGPPIEPRHSLAEAFSRQDNDTAPSCTHSEDLPPRYTSHNDHDHAIWSDAVYADGKRGRTRAPRHVNFIHDSPEFITPASEAPITPSQVPSPLKRGLQIPSRMGTVTSGFKLPRILEAQGVSKENWKSFTMELEGYALLSKKQWGTFVGISLGLGLFWNMVSPLAGVVPSTIMSYKLGKRMENENLKTAHTSGLLEPFTKRWNETYFEPLGFHVVVAIPGDGNMENMDVVSTKLFKYQQRMGLTSPQPGTASSAGGPKAAKYQRREGHQRVKAAQKVRIIFVPLEQSAARDSGQQESGQAGIRDYFSGEAGGDSESHATTPAPNPGWIPAGRLAAVSATTLQLVS